MICTPLDPPPTLRGVGALPGRARSKQHIPKIEDGAAAWKRSLQVRQEGAGRLMDCQHLHRPLADGSFVLTVCEGTLAGNDTAFYDLLRLADGRIVEHWDTVKGVAPRSEWKNDNGKF